MYPITRKEYYLAKAAGTYTGPTPPPVLREDYYLATLAGDYSGNCPAPVTRLEKYMSAAAGITSYVPQPVTRIEKYWYAISKGMGYVPEPVTREEKFLYAILKNPPKPEYLDKTAEGILILLPDSAEAPLTALTLYGWSKQDGTPTPDNPVPIVSAGDEGEIGVTVLGGNLLDSSEMEIGGFAGSSGIDFDATNRIRTGFIAVTSGETYTLSGYSPYNIANSHIFQADKKTRIGSFRSGVAIPENGAWVRISFQKADQGDFTEEELEALKNTLVFNAGSTALPYMPHKTPQTLTAQTPGGLPGIPVSSGGNYTDENGQQWICDEVDFKRGKYVHRVWRHTFDGSENWYRYSTYSGFYNDDTLESVSYRKPGFSNQFLVRSNVESTLPGLWIGVNNSVLYSVYNDFYDDSLEDGGLANWKAHLAAHPLEVMTYLETPIETDLSDEEIAAYKALHTYSPATTVSNDAGAWMKAGYKTPAE